jgi:hypothetical protein
VRRARRYGFHAQPRWNPASIAWNPALSCCTLENTMPIRSDANATLYEPYVLLRILCAVVRA